MRIERRKPVVMACLAMAVVWVTMALAATGSASAKVVWLCRPGEKPDPCTPGLSTTVYTPSLHELGVRHPAAEKKPAVDCFYVYPTVSDQKTGNANLQIDPEERSIALYQAARYSQLCRVYAPMYRQETLAGIGSGTQPTTKPSPTIGLRDVENAFRAYLKYDNHGRGFVLIGHSQGSFVLESLIAKMVDPVPSVRRRLLSAILLGGNVEVKQGTGVDGTFRHIPACRAATELGCVIAFSTFDQTPPTDTLFGRVSSAFNGAPKSKDLQVLCTNPAALGGGTGLLDPISPSAPFAPGTLLAAGIGLLHFDAPQPATVWWSAPDAYDARCETRNGATVLEISARDGAPTPTPSPDAEWGLHLLDANIALGNLLSIIGQETKVFLARS